MELGENGSIIYRFVLLVIKFDHRLSVAYRVKKVKLLISLIQFRPRINQRAIDQP